MARLPKEVVQADVLCIGGGPAGLMAAIRASELGAKVVVADKGNTLHSGSGSAGNDHFQCYIPEFTAGFKTNSGRVYEPSITRSQYPGSVKYFWKGPSIW